MTAIVTLRLGGGGVKVASPKQAGRELLNSGLVVLDVEFVSVALRSRELGVAGSGSESESKDRDEVLDRPGALRYIIGLQESAIEVCGSNASEGAQGLAAQAN